jgi:4-amino-4-deoxy-L-arabinose transferase-like glycosyltransferase
MITLGVTIYCLLFFATPFEPYEGLIGVTWTRFSFFSYILLPDEYFAAWLGSDGTVSLTDRLPVLLIASIWFVSASGYGWFILSLPPFQSWYKKISSWEHWLLSTVAGLSFCSLIIFVLGLCGNIRHPEMIRFLTILGILLFLFLNNLSGFQNAYSPQSPDLLPKQEKWSLFKKSAFFVILPVFSLLLILGGIIPSTDYDVLSYHLAGAREFAETGQIGFLPHNVYANMPFAAEMLYVWGIASISNSYIGAMIGKTLIAFTTILTALGLYTFNKRFFSETAGLIAMILYLSSPWIIYVSTAGLIDSVVGMYTFFAVYTAVLTEVSTNQFPANKLSETSNEPELQFCSKNSSPYHITNYLKQINWFPVFLCGFFAGSAAACKYPAMLFVVVPLAVFIAITKFRNFRFPAAITAVLIFAVGVSISCGGWYFKNYYYTGNPVYPLCFSIFGDSTGSWTSEIDARWTRVHSAHDFRPVTFFQDFWRVGLSSPWNAPLTIPFFLLVFIVRLPWEKRRILWLLLAWLVFVFSTWWFLTHRIDRFWLPALPVLTLLAGIGATWCTEKYWKIVLNILLIVSCVYCFLVAGSPAPGKNNRFFASLNSMRFDPNISTPWAIWFNRHPPEFQKKVLLVGEAKAFLYDIPVLYHSCFNESPLKEIAVSPDPAAEFQRRGIEFILVDWSEIARFRSPGNYGYSEIVQPALIDKLINDGIIETFCPTEELKKTSTVVYRVRNNP